MCPCWPPTACGDTTTDLLYRHDQLRHHNGGILSCTAIAPVNWPGYGGTSVSSPIMASIQALVVQHKGSLQGNPNPRYYASPMPNTGQLEAQRATPPTVTVSPARASSMTSRWATLTAIAFSKPQWHLLQLLPPGNHEWCAFDQQPRLSTGVSNWTAAPFTGTAAVGTSHPASAA